MSKHEKGSFNEKKELKAQNESGLQFLELLQRDTIGHQRRSLYEYTNKTFSCRSKKLKRRGGLDQVR